MKTWHSALFSATVALTLALTGCARHDEQEAHYVSPQVQGQAARINLEEVDKAFWASKGSDFNSWMGNFEKRVNEIYDGKEIVGIDAQRQTDKLVVTGFIDKNNQPGFQSDDDKLFTIEQTGQAANDQVPYRVSGYNGSTPYVYQESHHSLLDNPFLQAFLISQMFHGWGGHYYTPHSHYTVIHHYRDSYRTTPYYHSQQASNRDFNSRFKQKALGGGFESNRKFGDSSFSSGGQKKRSWFGRSSDSTSSGSSGSFWGGRRSSSSSSSSSGSRSGWGGSSSSSGSSWGGRRSSSSSSWGGSRRRR
jgi:uncharacterized membrane protein YgcG